MAGLGVLIPGRNCRRLVSAGRLAFLIGGEAYFSPLRAAIREARESSFLLGWDIDSRIDLVRQDAGRA